LDKLYEYGVTELFSQIASVAIKLFGIDISFKHLDTTTFSVFGEYKEDACEQPIKITRGYSKDHRPDLKQMKDSKGSYFIADSALYSEKNI